MKELLVTLVIAGIFAGPAFAKSNEYNFNTCKYNFYSNVDPFSNQSRVAPVVTTNPGIGANGAAAERMRTSIPVSIYEQTPQRTFTMQVRRPQRQVVTNYRPQQQQPVNYFYVPGQNNRSAQNNGQNTTAQTSVGVKYNSSSGAFSYDSVNTNTNK